MTDAMPHDLEAEQSVLGSILLSSEAMTKVATLVRPDHFYRDAHGRIYAAMMELFQAQEPIDNVTVAQTLEASGCLAQIGNRAYLAELQERVPSPASVSTYARIMVDHAVKRGGIRAAQETLKEGTDPSIDSSSFVNRAQQRFFSLAIGTETGGFERMGDTALGDLLGRLAEIEATGEKPGLATGFADIDSRFRLRKSELTIVAGNTSMGKTSFVLNVAVNVLDALKLPVAMFSLEMSRENLTERLVAQVAGVDSAKLRDGGLNPIEWEKVNRAVSRMHGWPLYMDVDPALDAMAMLAKARQQHQKERLGLVIVDYLQLMTAQASDSNRTQEVGAIAKACRTVARELDVPVIAVSQLSRANTIRPDKKPMLSDLRDSGELEAVADVVLFVHRPEYYKADEKPGIAEILVKKNRNGAIFETDLGFEKTLTQFRSLSWRTAA